MTVPPCPAGAPTYPESGALMPDTLFVDSSEFQRCPLDDSYPYQFASFRACDGTYRDQKFAANHAWAKRAADSGRIAGFIVYCVWRPNWQDTVATLKAMVGAPHPRMAVMLDVESWGGQITGDRSAGINAAREAVIAWLGGNRKRVIGYGNAYDLTSLWPDRKDARIILANYSANPEFPGKIAHQFTSSATVAPFGHPVDLNSADGYTPEGFAAALGLTGTTNHPATTSKEMTMDADVQAAFDALNKKIETVGQGLAAAISEVIHGDGQHPNSLDSLASGILGEQTDSVKSTGAKNYFNIVHQTDMIKTYLSEIAAKVGAELSYPAPGEIGSADAAPAEQPAPAAPEAGAQS